MADIPIELVDDTPLGMFSLNSLGGKRSIFFCCTILPTQWYKVLAID